MPKKLTIKQNTGIVEVTDLQAIDKLYNLCTTNQLDAQSDVQANLQTSAAYEDAVRYLAGIDQNDTPRFPNLSINVLNNNYYIRFADPEVASILASFCGDSAGVSKSAAAAVTQLYATANAATTGIFRQNTTIEYFDELKYFTGLTRIDSVFYKTYNLKSITFPSKQLELNNHLFDYTYTVDSSDITVNWNGGSVINNSNNERYIYIGVKGLTWKDSLIPNQTDMNKVVVFKQCTSINKIIWREGITRLYEWYGGMTGLNYVEIPTTVTNLNRLNGGMTDYCRDGKKHVLVIKAVNPPTWYYKPNSTQTGAGVTAGYGYIKFPTAIYVPDGSVNAYKSTVSQLSGSGADATESVWYDSVNIHPLIKPLSELPQEYLEMGTVTQEDIDRT